MRKSYIGLIKAIGLRRSKQQVTAMVMSVDDDGSGEISWEEFLNLLNVEIQSPKLLRILKFVGMSLMGQLCIVRVMFVTQMLLMVTLRTPQPRYYYKEGDIDELIELAINDLLRRKWLSANLTGIQATFDRFDDDNSGTMDVDELTILVGELKLDCTKEELFEAAPPEKEGIFIFAIFVR